MTKNTNSKQKIYDLSEERTFSRVLETKKVRLFLKNIFIYHIKVKIIFLVIGILIIEIYLLFGACVLEFNC
jgi:hypothetical protein